MKFQNLALAALLCCGFSSARAWDPNKPFIYEMKIAFETDNWTNHYSTTTVLSKSDNSVAFRVVANSTTNPTYQLVVTTQGNVGIGTAIPGKTLDVAGDVRASGNVYFSADDLYRMTAWMNCVAAARIAGKTRALITWPQDGRTTTCNSLCSTAVGPNGITDYTCLNVGYFGYSPTQNTSSQGSFGERLNWSSCDATYGPSTSYGFNSSMGLYMNGSKGTGYGAVCCCSSSSE